VKPGPTARAALVLVAFLAVFTVVDRMSTTGGGGTRTAAAPPAAQEPDTSAAATTTTAPPTTTRAPTTTTAAPTTTKGPTKSTLRPASGVTVQVLNGVWVTGLAHRVAGQVRAAGYDVVAAKTALGSYSVSRVYYTGGHRADAEAFKDRFPAFSVVEPAPANLSRRVALHVVIGKDYPGV
jgi:hypothetical protein